MSELREPDEPQEMAEPMNNIDKLTLELLINK
jgi:hypothetical protein